MACLLYVERSSLIMQKKKWFKIIIYLMLIAMIGSTLFIALEPLLFG